MTDSNALKRKPPLSTAGKSYSYHHVPALYLEDIEAIYELARTVCAQVYIESNEYENLTPSTMRQLPDDYIGTLEIGSYDPGFHIYFHRGLYIHLWTSSGEQRAIDLVESVRTIIEKRENKLDRWLRQSRLSFLVVFGPWLILIFSSFILDNVSIFQIGTSLYLVPLIAVVIWKIGLWDRRRSSVVPRYRSEVKRRGAENRDTLIITVAGGVIIGIILLTIDDIASWFINLF